MYSGMADVAALTGDPTYVKAIDTIWTNTVTKKLYITGGIGASGAGEAFGSHYQLPNMTAYNETCASVGIDYWNHRLFLLHGDAKYIDVMERTLYNGLDLRRLARRQDVLLPQPARVARPAPAQPVVRRRLLPVEHHALPGVGARLRLREDEATRSTSTSTSQGTGDVTLDGGRKVRLTQQTRYPWDGAVKLTVAPDADRDLRDQRAHSRLGARRAGAGRSLSVPRRRRRPATITRQRRGRAARRSTRATSASRARGRRATSSS